MSADRWRTFNAVWQNTPEEFKAEYFPDNPAPFGRTERDVYIVLFAAARPHKRNGKEVWITDRIPQSRLAALAGLKSVYYLRKVLRNLYALGMVKMVEHGGYSSEGSKYAIQHLHKKPKGEGY